MERVHVEEMEIVRDFGSGELCPNCNYEAYMGHMVDKCEHCGQWMLCCSVCLDKTDCGSNCYWGNLRDKIEHSEQTIINDFNIFIEDCDKEFKELTTEKIIRERSLKMLLMNALYDCLLGKTLKDDLDLVEKLIRKVGENNIFYTLYDFWIDVDEETCNILSFDCLEEYIIREFVEEDEEIDEYGFDECDDE